MKISLLAMPFLNFYFSSLGLTQIKGRLKEVFKNQVDVQLCYIHHDFYRFLGKEIYEYLAQHQHDLGIGEWIFRMEAFDNVKDNQDEYFAALDDPSLHELFAQHRYKIEKLGDFIDETIAKYKLTSSDIVGVNATLSVLPGLAFLRHLKRSDKQIITAMGGSRLLREMGEALAAYYPHVDYVCSGSGLISFPKLIKAIMEKDTDAQNAIAGIFSKTNIGKVGKLSDQLDINHPIELDYSDFIESYSKLQTDRPSPPRLLLENSRGCLWSKCRFCSLYEDQANFRVKQTDIAIKETNLCLEKYNCNIQMADNTLPRHYIKKVIPYLKVPEDLNIFFEVRPDYTEEEVKILTRNKKVWLVVGIESFSSDVLKLVDKGVNAFHCIRMLKLLVKYSAAHSYNILFQIPGMTAAMYEQSILTIKKLAHLLPPGGKVPIYLERNSLYWKEREKYGLELTPNKKYEHIYPYDRKFISQFAFRFVEVDQSSERLQLGRKYSPKLTNELTRWTKRWLVKTPNDLPRLYCFHKDGTPYIHDSRQTQLQEYEISPLAERMLEILQEPCDEPSIKDHFPGENRGTLTRTLNDLINRQLIFKERERVMSLTIDEYPEDWGFKGYVF